MTSARRRRPPDVGARLVIVALQLALVAGAAQADPPTSRPAFESLPADRLFEIGCRKLNEGDYAQAVASLSQAVAKRPDEPVYPLKLAEAYEAAGRRSDAQRTLELLDSQHPRNTDVRAALARLKLKSHEAGAAAALLEEVRTRLNADGLTLLAATYAAEARPAARDAVLGEALARYPDDIFVRLAWIDAALQDGCGALALTRIDESGRVLADDPRGDLLAARAYLMLDRALGQTELREIPGARAGQIVSGWLLLEQPAGQRKFLCCPEASAMYRIRRALAAGLDTPDAHLLHARIWRSAGRAETAYSVLRGGEPALLDQAPDEMLELLERLALELGRVAEFLRFAQQRADRTPARRSEMMHSAFLAAADHYGVCGDVAAAREFTRRALNCKPDQPDTQLRLAEAERDAGNVAEARRLYRAVLSGAASQDARRTAATRLAELAEDPPGGR
ncbi:cellulose synthase subunit BcsC [Phycisphaerae bacterium RAS1]|nr:cellulose synthase subunit BcsC [Phycisphaerae bacterium RAS1]